MHLIHKITYVKTQIIIIKDMKNFFIVYKIHLFINNLNLMKYQKHLKIYKLKLLDQLKNLIRDIHQEIKDKI